MLAQCLHAPGISTWARHRAGRLSCGQACCWHLGCIRWRARADAPHALCVKGPSCIRDPCLSLWLKHHHLVAALDGCCSGTSFLAKSLEHPCLPARFLGNEGISSFQLHPEVDSHGSCKIGSGALNHWHDWDEPGVGRGLRAAQPAPQGAHNDQLDA